MKSNNLKTDRVKQNHDKCNAMTIELTLALEASSGQASAALAQNGEIIHTASHDAAHGHAAWMVSLAEDVMAASGYGYQDLSLVLGGTGPGSFTGIRVALSAVKGLGLTTGTTPKGISSLAGLAAEASDGERAVISLIDSRRKTNFTQIFAPDLTPLSPIIDGDDDQILTLLHDHQTILSQGVIISGYHRAPFADRLKAQGLKAEPCGNDFPHASGLIRAYGQSPLNSMAPEPLYLAPPILGQSKASENAEGDTA